MESDNNDLALVSREIDVFLRGKYVLDEILRDGGMFYADRNGTTVTAVKKCDNRYEIQVFFDAANREVFEKERSTFSADIQKIYDDTEISGSGFKFLMLPVTDICTFNEVKRMIVIKKVPDRRPFPKEGALISRCGMRCDLCAHFTGANRSGDYHLELCERLGRTFGRDIYGENMMRCPGCVNKPDADDCGNLKHARDKGLTDCLECPDYPCGNGGVLQGGFDQHNTVSTLAADIDVAILPFMQGQLGN